MGSTRFDFKTKLKVKCASWPNVVELFTQDVSSGGIFLSTTEDVLEGEIIDFAISLPDGSDLALTGSAVRVATTDQDGKTTRGVGVKIDFPDKATEERLGALVSMARRGYHASPLMGLSSLPLRPSLRRWEVL